MITWKKNINEGGKYQNQNEECMQNKYINTSFLKN